MRKYDDFLGRFTTIDAMWEKSFSWTPYHYCRNNPVSFLDPGGEEWEFKEGSSLKFKYNFNLAMYYSLSKGATLLFDMQMEKTTYNIAETSGHNYYDPSSNTVYWNPYGGVVTNTGNLLSPTITVIHEASHAQEKKHDPKKKDKLEKEKDKKYKNKEEKRVITGPETEAARKLGEIKENEVTREDHGGTMLPTTSPIEVPQGVVIKGNRNK